MQIVYIFVDSGAYNLYGIVEEHIFSPHEVKFRWLLTVNKVTNERWYSDGLYTVTKRFKELNLLHKYHLEEYSSIENLLSKHFIEFL